MPSGTLSVGDAARPYHQTYETAALPTAPPPLALSGAGASNADGKGGGQEPPAQRSVADLSELTEQEKEDVERLKERDAEVRAHERAHANVGGQYAGSPTYEYERGPDRRQYAVGGKVPIDVSPVPGDPEETVEKMTQVKRAALAPSQPSSEDRQIAAQADAELQAARAEAQKSKGESGESGSSQAVPGGSNLYGSGLNVSATGKLIAITV